MNRSNRLQSHAPQPRPSEAKRASGFPKSLKSLAPQRRASAAPQRAREEAKSLISFAPQRASDTPPLLRKGKGAARCRRPFLMPHSGLRYPQETAMLPYHFDIELAEFMLANPETSAIDGRAVIDNIKHGRAIIVTERQRLRYLATSRPAINLSRKDRQAAAADSGLAWDAGNHRYRLARRPAATQEANARSLQRQPCAEADACHPAPPPPTGGHIRGAGGPKCS